MSAGFNAEGWDPLHAVPTYHRAGAGERTAPYGTAGHPLPLIIDSDPGLDDALAIGLAAASPEIDLLAVTTVGGNAVAHRRLRPAPLIGGLSSRRSSGPRSSGP